MAYLDAEPALGGPWPIILFSHGNQGIKEQSFFLTEHLASHGYLVVAPDHQYNTAIATHVGVKRHFMSTASLNTYHNQPDETGRFGIHGGRFVAETLMPLILNVEAAYNAASADKASTAELAYYQKHYIGRPPKPIRFLFTLWRLCQFPIEFVLIKIITHPDFLLTRLSK